MSDAVRRMFARIVRRYDIANDLLSFGSHRLWKRRLVAQSTPGPGGRVLDLATGTGDIAALYSATVGADGTVIGIDFCEEMVDFAARKHVKEPGNLRFELGDAMELPFVDHSFDTASISFGVRNVDDPVVALSEMRRVVRPGGTVVILETGQPDGIWGTLYRAYAATILPLVGGLLSGSFGAYSYLHKSSRSFPCGERFVALMNRAGLNSVDVQPLVGGIAFIYSAVVGGTVTSEARQRDVGKVER